MPSVGQKKLSHRSKKAVLCVDTVGRILEDYAKRRVFRGFTHEPAGQGKAAFKIVWRHDRVFDLILDPQTGTLQFPLLLPNVPADSTMYGEFKAFIQWRHADTALAHRGIDRKKARVHCRNRAGAVALSLTVKDGDYEYATRKLIHLVQEIFLVFLADGPYRDYVVEMFKLDPDSM
jgi:hypothetical protein